MNGVRRFLGGSGSPSAPSPPSSSAFSIPPLNFSLGKSGVTSRSPSPTKSSPLRQSSTDAREQPSQGSVPGLALRKDRKPPPNPSSYTNGSSSRPSSSGGYSSPVAGPSSPRRNEARASGFANQRDELLMGLLSSEAVVDSRGYAILTSEELEDLKKEQILLNSRLTAAERAHVREQKMRDAALHLEKLNSSPASSSSRLAKRTSEAVDAANRRVEAAQRELWRLKERAGDIGKRILEHQAGVLGIAVKELERKASGSTTEASESTGTGWSTPMSPSSSVTSMSIGASSRRFDGPHLFAGNEGAVVPRRPRPPLTQKEITELEERVREAEGLKEEMALMREEQVRWDEERGRWAAERVMQDDDREAWQREREDFEQEREELEVRLKALEMEQASWEQAREDWERERESLQQGQEEQGELAALREDVARLARELDDERQAREDDREMSETEKAVWEAERTRHIAQQESWDAERAKWDFDREDYMQHAKDEIDKVREELRVLIQTHAVPLYSRDNSLTTYVSALDRHLASGGSSAEETEALEKKLALEVEKSNALSEQLDAARAELNALETKIEDGSLGSPSERNPNAPLAFATDAEKIIALLQPLWTSLPAPESRASKFNGATRPFRTGSPTTQRSPGSPSISEMDVRSLKGLYSPRVTSSSPASSPDGTTKERLFSVEAFASRVQSLITDDRALIERLIRFAQAHDLLKKNAERAQKLASDSNAALATYQKQVQMLEKREASVKEQIATLQGELREQDEALERVLSDKQDLETSAAEQAETVQQLTESNASLSARVLALAEEAATAVRERDDLRGAGETQQMQQFTLLDELNAVQTENGKLRAQLRALGKL